MSSPSYYWAALFSLALHGVLLVLPADSGAATPPRVEIPLELLWEAPVSQASQAPSTAGAAGAAPLAAPASLSPSTPSAAAMQPSFASVQAAAPSDQVTGNLAAASAASSATAPPALRQAALRQHGAPLLAALPAFARLIPVKPGKTVRKAL